MSTIKNLISKYFEAKTVIETTALEPIKEKLEELTKPHSIYNPELLDELGNASFTLYGCKKLFWQSSNSNIKRKETTELLNWIKSTLPTNSEEKVITFCFFQAVLDVERLRYFGIYMNCWLKTEFLFLVSSQMP